MNIFVLDLNPVKAAQYHNDRHCVKMIVETTQLLSTSLPYLEQGRVGPYKATHLNHPCSIWTRSCKGNYQWLWKLGIALCEEYTHRYGRVHGCKPYLVDLKLSKPIPRRMTPFAQAMPERYRHQLAVTAYRAYYMAEKRHIATWTNREIPYWWK
ncbi:MAG TPA: pyrimidine dimer DNA glycosylase/endonuclease V [Candidatus Methylacidiphilales bacterium]|nr:pyrimidine dimer DNA glycosylase/endonuclease V [Candidatus Methylacidiphilales bacterium]